MSENALTDWVTRGHRTLPPGRNIHTPYRWEVNTERELESLTDVTEADILKTAFVHEIAGVFTLISVNPVVRFVATQGHMGPEGPEGPQGDRGPEGPQGPRGMPGERGPQGSMGPYGPEGPAGPKGERGPEGPAGPRGVPGDRGPDGPQGPRGEKGDRGPVGKSVFEEWQSQPGNSGKDFSEFLEAAAGPAGPEGPQGPIGPQGPAGPRGKSAYEEWLEQPGNDGKDFDEFLGESGGGGGAKWVVANIAERNGLTVASADLNRVCLVLNDGRGKSRNYRLNALSGENKWVEDNSPALGYELVVHSATGVLDFNKGQVFKVNGASNPSISITSPSMSGFSSCLTLMINGKGNVTWANDIDWVGGNPPTLGDTYTLIVFMLIDGRKIGQFSHRK